MVASIRFFSSKVPRIKPADSGVGRYQLLVPHDLLFNLIENAAQISYAFDHLFVLPEPLAHRYRYSD